MCLFGIFQSPLKRNVARTTETTPAFPDKLRAIIAQSATKTTPQHDRMAKGECRDEDGMIRQSSSDSGLDF
jgi:hypothetical protein